MNKPAARPALLICAGLVLVASIALIRQQDAPDAPATAQPAAASPQPTASQWLVRTTRGADGQDVHLATLLSANLIELQRTSGVQAAQLVLQRRGTSKKTDIMVRMPRGIFACDQDGCPALVRIDQGTDRAGKGFVIGLKLHNAGPIGFAFKPPGEPAWPR